MLTHLTGLLAQLTVDLVSASMCGLVWLIMIRARHVLTQLTQFKVLQAGSTVDSLPCTLQCLTYCTRCRQPAHRPQRAGHRQQQLCASARGYRQYQMSLQQLHVPDKRLTCLLCMAASQHSSLHCPHPHSK